MSNNRKTQTEACYRQLRRLLLHGQIPSGRRITEAAWSQELQVHRGALREAMSILAHEGLLERGAGGGLFVPQPTREGVREVLETRVVIEAGALRLLGLREGTSLDLKPLRQVCELLEQMMKEGFDLGFVEADRRFHERIVELADNRRLTCVYQQAPLPMFPSCEPDAQKRRSGMAKTLSEHLKICDFMEAGKVDEACQLLQDHLLASACLNVPIVE